MRIERVKADAFGCLRQTTLELAPGFTVVFGLNEAGKSTWHAAIYAALCGRRRGGGIRAEDREFQRRYFPWDGDQWSATAIIELADGTRVRMSQELAHANDCQAWDIGLNRDISSSVIFDGTPDASVFLGLDRRAFFATAFVRQADLDSVRKNAKALQGHIQRAAATRGADATAATALKAVDDYLREHVGLLRAGYRRPHQAAADERRAAREALARAREQHEDLFVQEFAIEAERTQTRLMQERLGHLTTQRDRQRLEQLQWVVTRIEELSAKYPHEPQGPDVGSLLARARRAVAEWDTAPPPVDLSGPSVGGIEAEIASLAVDGDGDVHEHPDVTAAARDYGEALNERKAAERMRPDDPPMVEAGGLDAETLRQLASELSEPAPPEAPVAETPQSTTRTWLLLVAGCLALLGVGGLVLGEALGAVGLVAAAGVVVSAMVRARRSSEEQTRRRVADDQARTGWERQQAEARGRAVSHGLPTEPEELRAIARALEDASAAERQRRAWEDHRGELENAVAERRQRFAAILDEHGAPDAPELTTRLDLYVDACRRRERRATLERLLPGRRTIEATADRRAAAEDGMRQTALACGVGIENDTDAAYAALTAWIEDTERALDESVGANQEWQELQLLLREQSLDELRAERDRLAGAAVAVDDPQLEIPMKLDELETEIERLTEEVTQRELTTSSREGALDAARRRATSVTEAEERDLAAEAELSRVEGLKETLKVARKHLSEAQDTVHRNIAPVLQSSIEGPLRRITGGKYGEVSVDPETLAVSVLDERGRYRDVADLSHGTAEQVYLLLRVALAEHLTKDGEVCPLLLDEVTVQSDTSRTRAILELLRELSEDHQIVLFTQEDDVRDWAEDHLVEPQDRVFYI